jgi:hypothetical protein
LQAAADSDVPYDLPVAAKSGRTTGCRLRVLLRDWVCRTSSDEGQPCADAGGEKKEEEEEEEEEVVAAAFLHFEHPL